MRYTKPITKRDAAGGAVATLAAAGLALGANYAGIPITPDMAAVGIGALGAVIGYAAKVVTDII